MADRPILFSAPMVRALLERRKTQTRRALKPLPRRTIFFDPKAASRDQFQEPRIAVGDRLYVREAWHAARSLDSTKPRDIPRDADIEHAATARGYAEIGLKGKQRPGMFLPRWASRLTLTVTDVRVHRLQDISEADAAAEGVEQDSDGWRDYQMPGTQCCANAHASFRTLWDSLNAARGFGWDANPWVAAYTFTVQPKNIDRMEASHG